MVVAPCKDCADRMMGCHGRCEKYQSFRAARTEDNEHEHMMKVSAKGDKSWFEKQFRRKARYSR